MRHGEATWQEDHLVPITRGDAVVDVYWSYSYSPVWAEDGRVGGILVTVQETTRRVLAERRTRVLRDLATRARSPRSEREVIDAAIETLRQVPRDLPLAAVYLRGRDHVLQLVGQTSAWSGAPAWPDTSRAGHPAGRVLDSALESVESILVSDLSVLLAGMALESDPDGTPPPSAALLVPIPRGESSVGAEGVLVAALGSRLPLNREYRDFLDAIAAQIGHNIAVARSDEASRRRTEALSEEAARLAELLERAPGFVAVLRGPDHVFEVVTSGYRALVGERELIGLPTRDALPEILDQGYLQILDRVLTTGEPYRATGAGLSVRLTPDGPLVDRHVDLMCQRIDASATAPAGVFVYGVDATERHEAARALADSERRYRLLVESIPQVVWIADREGRLEYLSPWVEHHAGGPLPTVEERITAGADTPADAERAIRAWRDAILRGAPLEVEGRAKRFDGTVRWVLVRGVPFRDEKTGALRWFGTVTDIDALKRADEQLREAQRMQAVGTLAGGVAHEINNQMTSVLGFGQFVLRALGPDHPQTPDMRVMLQSADRASRVTQHLLAFTRQQITQRRQLDLLALVLELEPLLAQVLGTDKSLIVKGPRDGVASLPHVLADPDQVQQVLVNLVANARDATETGGRVEIGIEGVQVTEPLPAPLGETVPTGHYLRLHISDSGCGIAPEMMHRIFDPFFTTKMVGAGTGLGLSMVHGTLRRHGGYVRAESRLGTGTTIELFWPLAEHDAPEASPVAPVREGAAGMASRQLTVMVVEDEPSVRALAVRALEEAGYKVEGAATGRAALDRLSRDAVRPDVVVTDVIMPQLNGRQLFDAVRARWPDLPVLFTSGHTGESEVYRRMVPADAPFLRKPFTPEALVDAVTSLASRPIGSGQG
jgi:PAS domain S-box-containing protein